MGITRRRVLVSSGALLVGAGQGAADMQAIEARHGGRLGVFALDTADGRSLAYRADERFTLCSTMKFPLAACVLARAGDGSINLAEIIRYNQQDLDALGDPDSHCPVTRPQLPHGALTIATLCEAGAAQSDNLAANLLLKRVGGPAAVTAFLRSIGDTVTRCDRPELALNSYDGVLDTTSPRAMATTARAILLGAVLQPVPRALLESWLTDSASGAQRLRAAVPPDWLGADKTGTGFGDEANDVALFRPPGRKPLIVAAYYNARPNTPIEKREDVLREAGHMVAGWAASGKA